MFLLFQKYLEIALSLRKSYESEFNLGQIYLFTKQFETAEKHFRNALILSKNNWEIQIDIETSEIYSSNYRRSDIIESIHDGSFFSEVVKYGWFLPSGILLLTLSLTGIYMFFIPILKRRKRNK